MVAFQTETVEFPMGPITSSGYLAEPKDSTRHPGIVVIQEYWGLVPHIKSVAERFASQGYVALVPDLYHGETATEPDEARKLAMQLKEDEAVKEITAAGNYLLSRANVYPKALGVIGFCMGGGLAIATAAKSSEIGAVVVYYGSPHTADRAKSINAPLLGLYAEHDRIPKELIENFAKELSEKGIPHEIHFFPGTQHAFFNDTRPGIYNPEAAQKAWDMTLKWLGKYLTA
jgi:carboxymethylenebutenolidase